MDQAEQKKKLMILLGMVGLFIIVFTFAVVIPTLKKRGGDEEVASSSNSKSGLPPGAPPGAKSPAGGPAGGPPGTPGAGPPGGPGGMPSGMPAGAGGPGGPPGGAPPSAGPPGGAPSAGGVGGATPGGGTAVATATPLLPTRSDPFSPLGFGRGALTGGAGKTRAVYDFERLAALPPVRIQEENPTHRRAPAPPSGTRRVPPEKPGARLSGILLNKRIYAILEKQVSLEESLTGRKGYVVKPGDIIDDMQIVKITVSREGREMVPIVEVKEQNGERRLIRLQEAPQATGGAGGAVGMPGAGAGGFPGGR